MKNFEMRCPVDGTSALQPRFEQPSSSAGTIIAFPGQHAVSAAQAMPNNRRSASESGHRVATHMRVRLNESDMVQCLRYGSAQGLGYNRIAPWQAVAAGLVFSLTAFGSILLGL